MASISYTKLIDISQPVTSSSACFPGDTPFSRSVTLSYGQSGIINLTALTMSPHVGTHADAPVHIQGSLDNPEDGSVADMPLDSFIGPVYVMNLAVKHDAITLSEGMTARLKEIRAQADKVLFRTLDKINYNQFETQYSYIGSDMAEQLGALSFKLVGLDTPSVDHIDSKDLETHHILEKHKLVWLENLDLTCAEEGYYQLLALPLKFLELEASPLRAVLLK